MLTNDIISFEQLGPDTYFFLFVHENVCCVYHTYRKYDSNKYSKHLFL